MTQELTILAITAASIGFFHTLFGPDHYLPFVVMSQTGKWSMLKTTWITVLCGIGHILSSIILGFVGIGLGFAVIKLEAIESVRGSFAAWALIAFGLVYFVWGLRKAFRNKPHKHLHAHDGKPEHTHAHTHQTSHVHIHQDKTAVSLTPWVLFVIFILGPCEPLIPILMYPAAQNSLFGVLLVAAIFGTVTITTMLSIVLISSFGISFLPMKRMERYTHAIAGATIFLSGMAIQFLGF